MARGIVRIFSHGLVSPVHSPRVVTITANYTQASDGMLLMELTGNAAGQFSSVILLSDPGYTFTPQYSATGATSPQPPEVNFHL